MDRIISVNGESTEMLAKLRTQDLRVRKTWAPGPSNAAVCARCSYS